MEQTPEIACRYTEGDPDFAKEMTSVPVPPPIVTQWAGPRPFYGGRGGGGGGRGGDRHNNYQDRKRPYDQGGRTSDGHNNYQQQDRNKRPYYDQGGRGGGGHNNYQDRRSGGNADKY